MLESKIVPPQWVISASNEPVSVGAISAISTVLFLPISCEIVLSKSEWAFYFMCGKWSTWRQASCQNLKNKRCSIRVTELLRCKRILLTNRTYNATFRSGIVRRKLVLLLDHFVVLQHCGDLALRHHVHHLIAACLELAD